MTSFTTVWHGVCCKLGVVYDSHSLGYRSSSVYVCGGAIATSKYLTCRQDTTVVGVMKMGNTVPRAGLEPTSLALRASVLPLHHIGFPDVTTILTPTCLCGSLPQRSVHTTTQFWYDLTCYQNLKLQQLTNQLAVPQRSPGGQGFW